MNVACMPVRLWIEWPENCGVGLLRKDDTDHFSFSGGLAITRPLDLQLNIHKNSFMWYHRLIVSSLWIFQFSFSVECGAQAINRQYQQIAMQAKQLHQRFSIDRPIKQTRWPPLLLVASCSWQLAAA
jgi:hypothetical protein